MLQQLSLLATLGAVLVAAQFPPGPDTTAGCTSKSFSVPSWFLNNLHYSGSNVTFSAVNRANNYTASLACKVGEAGSSWNACAVQGKPFSNDTISASVQVSESDVSVKVGQTWTCTDRPGKVLTFTAAGDNTIARNKTNPETNPSPNPFLVKGVLSAPVAISPLYAEGPVGHDLPGCSAKSEKPTWVLSNIRYIDQPGDGETATPMRHFNLVVTNPANGYEASCMPSDPTSGEAGVNFFCAGYEFQSSVIGRYSLSTSAFFDPETNRITVNQTWYCDDQDPAAPVQITATGSQVLPLNCAKEPVPNSPDITMTVCTAASEVTLSGKPETITPLTPYSIEDPVPARDACTITSVVSPQWTFSHFTLTTEQDKTTPVVSFDIILATQNRGFQYPIEIYQGAPVEGGSAHDGWYECDIGPDGGNGLPLWPNKCSFKYDTETKDFTLRANWACEELDPENPVTFTGVTNTKVNASFSCEKYAYDGSTICTTEDPGLTWTAAISNVTWTSNLKP